VPAYDIHTLLRLVVFFLSLLVTLLLHFIFVLLLLLFLFKCLRFSTLVSTQALGTIFGLLTCEGGGGSCRNLLSFPGAGGG